MTAESQTNARRHGASGARPTTRAGSSAPDPHARRRDEPGRDSPQAGRPRLTTHRRRGRRVRRTVCDREGPMQADEIRTQQRQTWDRFSAGWVKWDELVMAMLAPVRDAIVTGVAPAPDAEHLDIASGTGEPGLTIAAMAPDGHVVLSDLSIGMLDSAREAAAARGLANVEFREADASALPFDDASFDSVSCRFGFMFFPDLAAAAREIARVLRPGGVVSTSVWAGPESNEWAVVPMMIIAGVVDVPRPPPDAPGLFRCAAPGFVPELFRGAGLDVLGE